MKTRTTLAFICLAAILATGCNLVQILAGPTPTATATPTRTLRPTSTVWPTWTRGPTSTRGPTYTPRPTYTLRPTYTPRPTSTATATRVALPISAMLTIKDLPAGFEVLPKEDMTRLKLTERDLARSFSSVASQATAQNLAAFINADQAEIVISLIVYPLSPLEKVSMDLMLDKPTEALNALAAGMAGSTGSAKPQVTPVPGADKIGDKSVGGTFPGSQFQIDMVVSRRDTALAMVFAFYRVGARPTASTIELAKTLDGRLAAVIK